MSNSIECYPEDILKEGVETSRKMYDFIERDFDTITEYVALDTEHFDVYSPRIANIILRVGPEIFRVFDLILFNEKIKRYFEENPKLEKKILQIQRKKKKRNDRFIDYLDALPELTKQTVKVKVLEDKIRPFEIIEEKSENRKFVDWWENGYNALRHRTLKSFRESATLKNALFSLAGLWVLHERLDREVGMQRGRKSPIFIYYGNYVAD
jgi:seryl-tRNA synthetase